MLKLQLFYSNNTSLKDTKGLTLTATLMFSTFTILQHHKQNSPDKQPECNNNFQLVLQLKAFLPSLASVLLEIDIVIPFYLANLVPIECLILQQSRIQIFLCVKVGTQWPLHRLLFQEQFGSRLQWSIYSDWFTVIVIIKVINSNYLSTAKVSLLAIYGLIQLTDRYC